MSGDDQQMNDAIDSALDAAVRAALDSTRDAASPEDQLGQLDPDLVLAYLQGSASDEQVERMQQALARSPALRRELADIAADLERLRTAAVAEAMSEVNDVPSYSSFVGLEEAERVVVDSTPAPRRVIIEDRPSLWDQIRSLFQVQRPAMAMASAYVLTVMLMAYPTYQYLTGSFGETSDTIMSPRMVLPTSRLSLRPEANLRGSTTTPPLEVVLSETGSVLDLRLRTLNPRSGDERYQVTVSNEAGTLWQDEDFAGFTGDDSFAFHLLLNAQGLEPGQISIRITRINRTTGDEILTETYGLLFR